MQVDLTDCLSSTHSFPSQSLPEKYRMCLIQMKTIWAISSAESNFFSAGCFFFFFFFQKHISLHWRWNDSISCFWGQHHILFMWKAHLPLKNLRIGWFFQLDVPWVAPLLGMNANVLDIFLCIFAVLRVPSIVYYVSAFLLSVWHPKQQHWLSECLEGC